MADEKCSSSLWMHVDPWAMGTTVGGKRYRILLLPPKRFQLGFFLHVTLKKIHHKSWRLHVAWLKWPKQPKGNYRCSFLLCSLCGRVFHLHVQQDLCWHNKLDEIDPGPAMQHTCLKDVCIRDINILFLIANGLLKTLWTFYSFMSLVLHHKSLVIHWDLGTGSQDSSTGVIELHIKLPFPCSL